MLYSGEQILSFKPCLVFYAGDSLKSELKYQYKVWKQHTCIKDWYSISEKKLCKKNATHSFEIVTPVEQMSRDMINQQSDCVPSEDSDQPGHPPSLIRVFAVRSVGS